MYLTKFRVNQKFRVIVDGISFFTTKKAILAGVGDHTKVNSAVSLAYWALEHAQSPSLPANGLVGRWENLTVQIDVVNA